MKRSAAITTPDVDRDHEIDEHREAERDQQHEPVRARRAREQPREMPHVAHVPGDVEKDRGERAASGMCAAQGASSRMTRTRKTA